MKAPFKQRIRIIILRYFPHFFRYISYFRYVMYHKYIMFAIGCHMGLPYRCLFLHDMDKLNPKAFHYGALTFYDDNGNQRAYEETEQYQAVWLDHQKRNKHHWQAWVLIGDDGSIKPLPIHYPYAHEMVADYIAFSVSVPDSLSASEYYLRKKDHMVLHPLTRSTIELLLVTYDDMDRKLLSNREELQCRLT